MVGQNQLHERTTLLKNGGYEVQVLNEGLLIAEPRRTLDFCIAAKVIQAMSSGVGKVTI